MVDIFTMRSSWLISVRWDHHGWCFCDEIIMVDIIAKKR